MTGSSAPPPRLPRPKERDFMATELELDRRRPEMPGKTASAIAALKENKDLLSGIMVDTGMAGTGGTDEAVLAGAAETVRAYNNKHDCLEAKGERTCAHPRHWHDAAMLRSDLMKLGLPESASFRPPEGPDDHLG